MHSMMKPRKSPDFKAWVLFVPALLLCLMVPGCATKESPGPAAKKREGGPAVPVTVATVSQKDVPIDIHVVGNVEPCLTVTVKAQVSGEITQVFFREGDYVKEGDQLFTIDQRTHQAQLNQSQANLARDQAVLTQVEANLARDQAQEKYAQTQVARYANLFERRLVSREQMDQMRANADAISAAVRADMAAIQSARATVEATKAAVENVKVMLGYTVIRSPTSGRTGNLDVDRGNVITPNTTLMTINQLEPIYVSFSVPEAQLRAVRKSQTVMASSPNSSAEPQMGILTFIDNEVDSTTGTIRLKATFPNADHKLWPGEFVRVTLRLAIRPNAVVVPNQVVQTGQDGSYVFVVKPDQTVETRAVVAGERLDQEVVIESGLQPGEIVVAEGQLRLAPGSRVQLGGEMGRGSSEAQGGQRGGKRQGKGGDMP